MVFPLLVSMILMMAYNLVDSIWVGNLLGEQGYAALTSGTSIILILNSIAMGAGNGISIQISQAVGAGEKKKSKRYYHYSYVTWGCIFFERGNTF